MLVSIAMGAVVGFAPALGKTTLATTPQRHRLSSHWSGIKMSSTPASTVGEDRDPSGIALVGDASTQAQGLTYTQAIAFDVALRAAMSNPDQLGYPWIEPNTGVLDLSAATAQGAAVAESELAMQPIMSVPTRIT